MKIAISSQEKDLASPVACHFGRCCYFCIYDDDTGQTEWYENCDREQHECSGKAILECLVEKGISHVVSADFGPHVMNDLTEKQIRMTMLSDCSKSVGDIIRIIHHKKLV